MSEAPKPQTLDPKWDSPGNAYAHQEDTPPMKRPGMDFLWRIECDIDNKEVFVGAPHGAGVVRSIANITGGKCDGPLIKGEILGLGGADWSTTIEGTHSSKLDARYTLKTDDGQYLYITVIGLFRPGPGTAYAEAVAENVLAPPTKEILTQDDVEFFSHYSVEAGPGKYNWVNGLICVGVMTFAKTRTIIDAYYLTNFPGVSPQDVKGKVLVK